jgi:lipopolysaccharide export system protein LptA
MASFGKHAAALLVLGAAVMMAADVRPTPAFAQGRSAFGAGNGPIDISADQLEVIDAENRAVWRGNVEAVQGRARLRAPVLTVYFGRNGQSGEGSGPGTWGQIQRMEADGPVYYVTAEQNARGDHATYDAASNTIVMTGNVVLVQDKNVVQGDRLTIDTRTNHSTLENTAQGGRKRVRGVFYPSQNQAQNQGTGAAAPATARP